MPHHSVKRVFYFTSAKWALDDVAKRRIKIARIDELNDPFELWCVSQPHRELRDTLRSYKKEMNEKFGLVCFSDDWVNPLMWSHYAEKHRGICLGFDVDTRVLHQVRYVSDRPSLEVPPTLETAQGLLWTKFRDWSYEREWRAWLQLDERENGLYFYRFETQPDFMRLREVIVGPICDFGEAQVRHALNGHPGDVKLIKARLAFNSFQVVIKQNGFQPC